VRFSSNAISEWGFRHGVVADVVVGLSFLFEADQAADAEQFREASEECVDFPEEGQGLEGGEGGTAEAAGENIA
jgi:hypothetical protein